MNPSGLVLNQALLFTILFRKPPLSRLYRELAAAIKGAKITRTILYE